MKKLVIIDGKSVFYRGYYAMGNLSLEDGTPTGGVYGFASLAFEVIRKLKPDYVVVAWDKKGTSTAKRSAIYPEYKAGRKKAPDDFYEQIPLLKDFLKTLGWPLFETDGYEADDILGTLAVQANKLGIEANLITSDLDMLQLIDEKHFKVILATIFQVCQGLVQKLLRNFYKSFLRLREFMKILKKSNQLGEKNLKLVKIQRL